MRAARADVTRVRRSLPARGAAMRGGWPERVAAILTLTDGAARGQGEAAPLPGFGADSIETAEASLRQWIDDRELARVASPAARFAIETASAALAAAGSGRELAAVWAAPGAPHAIATAAVVDGVAEARAAVAAGHVALKVKLTGAGERDRLAAIRAALPAIALRADANRTWPLAEVDDRLTALAELGLEYVEEPAAGLAAQLEAPRAVPIALDESLAEPGRERWLPAALASGAVVALVCKPTVLGGVAACRALQARAADHGVDAVWSHALEGPIGFAAVIAVARALGGRRAAGVAPYPGLDLDVAPASAPARSEAR